MTRWPLVPTLLVSLAVAVMVALGVWQLQRAQWKNALLAEYTRAATLPEVAWPAIPNPKDPPLFRRATGFCLEVTGWRSTAGRNLKGEAGWSHIAACRTGGAEGPGMQADMGWSRAPADPAWRGGPVNGTIAPDTKHVIRLIATTPAPGLVPSLPPNPADIPNNHLAYAVQWFVFAAIAAIIYWLALRRRGRLADPASGG